MSTNPLHLDAQFAQIFGGLPVAPDLHSLRQLDARERFITERLPVKVAELRENDAMLARCAHEARCFEQPSVLAAFRNRDAIELLRLLELAVGGMLESRADWLLGEEAEEQFPEDV